MKEVPILLGRGHVPIFALRSEASSSEKLAGQMMFAKNENVVSVLRFDLNDREKFYRNVLTEGI